MEEELPLIGGYLDSELVKLMPDSSFFCMMIDEWFESKEEPRCYVSIVNSFGHFVSHFAHIAEIKHCDTAALTDAIIKYLEEKQIDVSKVAGLGRDGAIVMVGRHNAVGAMLKRSNPFKLHYVVHKRALVSVSAISSVPYCNQHHSILQGLYNYFHISPSKYSVSKGMMEILNDP